MCHPRRFCPACPVAQNRLPVKCAPNYIHRDSHSQRILDRAPAERNTYVKYSAERGTATRQPTTHLVTDIRNLEALAMKSSNRNSIPAVVVTADRCTDDAEVMLPQIQGMGAGGKAVSITGRTLYLGQRAVRDYLIVAIDELFDQVQEVANALN